MIYLPSNAEHKNVAHKAALQRQLQLQRNVNVNACRLLRVNVKGIKNGIIIAFKL